LIIIIKIAIAERYFYTKITNHMSVLILLIGLSLVVAIGFLVSFLWSVRSGQYDDDKTPAMRMLFDDEKIEQ
jgi:cbb3-type cytochrome oxidase maturation protein